MNQWSVLYEYCDTHENCNDTACRKTVVLRSFDVPKINLLDGVTNQENRDTTARGRKIKFVFGFSREIIRIRSIFTTLTRKVKPNQILSTRRVAMLHNLYAADYLSIRASARGGSTRKVTFRMPVPAARLFGLLLLALGLGGILGPMIPELRMEAGYALGRMQESRVKGKASREKPMPKSVPVVFEPLTGPDGAVITPVDTQFGLVIPKIGVNAPVIPDVNPANASEYTEALQKGVAHASTSFTPDLEGTVYLFSHSTNYEWFVRDLNAVFYLVKNLEKGDNIVLIYKGKRYTYAVSEKKVVAPNATSYIEPAADGRHLILQTCWPPGSTTERLLIFADLVETSSQSI
jgi:LPXTG-site transpeptidase (sortase) family protein